VTSPCQLPTVARQKRMPLLVENANNQTALFGLSEAGRRIYRPLTSAENQPLDWSAGNSLISIVVASALCGLQAFRDAHVAETMGLRRAESDHDEAYRPQGAVHKNPREPHGTRGDRRKKSNQRAGWIFCLVELGGFEPAANSSPERVLADPCEIRVNGSVLLADRTRTPVQSRTPKNEPDVDSRLAMKLAALAQH